MPALQSGSLFGGANGLLVMDAQNLLKAEVDVIVVDVVVTVLCSTGIKRLISVEACSSTAGAQTPQFFTWISCHHHSTIENELTLWILSTVIMDVRIRS